MAFFDLFSWLLKRPYNVSDYAPTLTNIADQSINAGETLTLTLSSTSPQGYIPTYSVDTLPDGATLVDNIFTWEPDVDDVGDTYITFTVTDAGGSDSQLVHITVVAWSINIVPLLRVIIDDYNIPYTYSNSKLHQIICVAALSVQQEIEFDNIYTINLISSTINPTPTETAFINLTALKSACIIGMGESYEDAGNAIKVGDDSADIDRVKVAQTKIQWSEDICKKYYQALRAYRLGKYVVGNSIVTPFGDSLYYYRKVRGRG